MTYNKINIFFDTNVLEQYGENEKENEKEKQKEKQKKCLASVSKIIMSHDFYDILKFAKLDSRIKLFIPELVWGEMENHLLFYYTSQKQSLSSHIVTNKKIFSDLLDISCNFKEVDYPEYLKIISKEFWDANEEYCELVEYPKNDELLKVLVEKALSNTKPFRRNDSAGKAYSDAGFKDAVIIETMLSFCKDDELNILYTKDNDFCGVFEQYGNENYRVINDLKILKPLIEDFIEPNNIIRIQKFLEEDQNIKAELFNQIEIIEINEVKDYSVTSVEYNEQNDNFIVKISATVNEALYTINATYKATLNEITVDTYYTEND